MKRILSFALVAMLVLCSLVSFTPTAWASDPNYNPGYEYDYPFTAGDKLEFTIELYDPVTETPTGVSYTLTGNPYSLVLGDMVDDHTVFTGGDLGLCAFVESGGIIALRTGMKAGGTYDRHYSLVNEVYFNNGDMVLIPGSYYAIPMCSSDNTHELTVISVVEPTCTEEGARVWGCHFCTEEVNYETIPALGHKRNLLGQCTRTGCGDNPIGDFFAPVTDAVGDAADNLKDFFSGPSYEDDFEKYGDYLSAILSLGLGILLVFLLWPLLKVLVDLIVTVVKAASSGIKKLSKRSKTKSKK